MVRATGEGLNVVRYWDLTFNTVEADEEAEREMDPETAVAEFRRIFEESVRLRLQGDVEVGTYLSGRCG